MSDKKTFRLFVSSTFSDFRREREVLQTKVFPHIKEYASNRGYTFQPIDLRWGVSNEAQLDQKTLELCLEEVRSCKTYPHPNFLIMIGDRYGWVPLPYAIENSEYHKIIDYLTHKKEQDHMKLRYGKALSYLREWYVKDENEVPVSYILKERKKNYILFDFWNREEDQLRNILQEAVLSYINIAQEEKRKYFISATEWEVDEGIIPYIKPTKYQEKELLSKNIELLTLDSEHIFGFLRNIDKTSQIKKQFIGCDYEEAQAFKKRLSKVLIDKNTLYVNTVQIEEHILEESYLEKFSYRMIKFLESQFDAQYAKERQNKNSKFRYFFFIIDT